MQTATPPSPDLQSQPLAVGFSPRMLVRSSAGRYSVCAIGTLQRAVFLCPSASARHCDVAVPCPHSSLAVAEGPARVWLSPGGGRVPLVRTFSPSLRVWGCHWPRASSRLLRPHDALEPRGCLSFLRWRTKSSSDSCPASLPWVHRARVRFYCFILSAAGGLCMRRSTAPRLKM